MNINPVRERLRNKKTYLYILIILILAFILSNSMDNPSESYSKSQKVMECVSKVLIRIFGPEHYFTRFFIGHVRKIAHFVEYMILGIAASSMMKISGKTGIQNIYNSLSFAVIIAVVDEFIQIYTYRGSSVRDVIIDFSGYFIGTVLTAFAFTVINLFRMIKKRNDSE